MAYFNHAFQKVFVGYNGFVTTPGTTTQSLSLGEFTFVDPTTWTTPANLDPVETVCCPLVLVAGSIYQNDKIGKFHGGYKESNKSKIINPKYVSKFYRVDPCTPQQHTISIGVTPFTISEGTSNCQRDFLCDETYYLRIDIKGSPVLQSLSRNTYFTADAYTGCCDPAGIAPSPVDPTTVYIAWATQLLKSPVINPFIQISIFDTTNTLVATYTAETYKTAEEAGTNAWINYSQVPGATGLDAGMYITGAYVDTRFGDCTFYPSDSIIALIEPVKVYASEVDYNGDPCTFTGICVVDTCCPIQGSGFGENVIRDLILSEGYNQTPFYTGNDLRIREITQGYDVTTAISRTSTYTRYYLLHNVPRFNNPTGVFDNDQYLLEIITTNALVSGLASTGASSSTAASGSMPAFGTISVSSTAGLIPGMTVSKTSGTGTIVAGAYILEVLSATQFTITLGSSTAPISVALDNTTVLSAESDNAAFEDFVNAWLECAQGAACVQLETQTCAEPCSPPMSVE